jgi:hypothetical protein
MQLLKQNTAATVLVGPVLDSAGAAVTNAVIGDFQITKNGTSAAMASPATRTHSHNGFYLLSLATGDTDTIGRLVISVNNTAQSMSTHRYTVLLPSVFDALITNATNSTGGLPAATNTITALAGAISTFAGGAVASVTNRVTANVDQWGGVSVTGMPLPTASYTAPPSAATNATAVRSELATELGRMDAAVSSRSTLTAAGVRSELAVELGRIDTTVGSRLATAGYTAPPSAATNATAVRTELAVELGRIDVTVSSRLATASYTAPLSAASTASAVWDALIASYTVSGSFGSRVVRTDSASSGNQLKITASGHAAAVVHDCEPDSIPEDAFLSGAFSARVLATDASAEVATSVRTELAVELGRIDVTVGSRLATSGYTPPPSAATNAGAVRSELAVELGRIDTTVSSRAAASDMATLLSRLGAFTGSGVNTVLGLLKAIMSKAAATPSDVGGTFSATTDSIEAIRDAQQAGTGDASQATLEAVQDTVDAIAASLSGTPIEVVGRVADGGSITLYAGDDMRVRSGTEISVTITDVGGVIYSRLNTIGIANLAFGASRPSQPAGAIDGTVAALSQAGAGASQAVTIDIEITDGGQGLAYADNYVWQIVSSRAQGSEYDTYTEIEGSLAVRRRVAVPVHA